MASSGNLDPNQQNPSFDVPKFFKPPNQNLLPSVPNLSNLSSSPFPPPSSSYPPPTGLFSYPLQNVPFHPQYHPIPHLANQLPFPPDQLSDLHHRRSLSFPTPPLQPSSAHNITMPQNIPVQNSGARILAMIKAPGANLELLPQPPAPLSPISSTGIPEFPGPPSDPVLVTIPNMLQGINSGITPTGPIPMPSSKLSKGRHLFGDNVAYDVNVRLQGEAQPQLEVTPITKYGSDPQLVLGRQIAVNKTYISYGLKQGNIRVLNINTALRSLFRGHEKRVTDMAFFAEDVHLLASVDIGGLVYVWEVSEGPDEEGQPQITGKVIIAIHIKGEEDVLHPRICWHCHKQEVLVVGFGKSVLRIDTNKVGKCKQTAEVHLKVPIEKLIDGLQLVGKHDREVTGLSMCQWMTSRLVSSSMDGTVKIWDDHKVAPLVVLRPHEGRPVNAAMFLTSPHHPGHIVLITAGPLNREVKVWCSASEEGWLLPSDVDSWKCSQTLELKSSAEHKVEESFFNQIAALSQAGLLLIANAKKNAIYAVHIDYGPNPATTRMDYIAEFTATMPILSFTGMSEILDLSTHIVQVYCVQTQAIQQYALYLSQCLPPPFENVGAEREESDVSNDPANVDGLGLSSPASKPIELLLTGSATKATTLLNDEDVSAERYPISSISLEASSSINLDSILLTSASSSPPLPLSPRLSRNLSGFRSLATSFESIAQFSDSGSIQLVNNYPVDRQMDSIHLNSFEVLSVGDDLRNIEEKLTQEDLTGVPNPPMMFRHPTHLITPSEILKGASSSDATTVVEDKNEEDSIIQDVVVNNDMGDAEWEVKVVGKMRSNESSEYDSWNEPRNFSTESKEKLSCSQGSDLGIEVARECSATSSETYIMDGGQPAVSMDALTVLSHASEENQGSSREMSEKLPDSSQSTTISLMATPNTKGKKHKGKNSQASRLSSPSPSAINLSNEPCSSIPSVETVFPHILAMQDTLNQLMATQKELQNQIQMIVAVPVTKEGRRLETALGRSMEKTLKANNDCLWSRIQEENVKNDKSLRDCTQKITTVVNSFTNKDLPVWLDKTVKKEMAGIGPAVVRTITPVLEKTISSSITDSFQRGVSDKAVNQLEKSVNSKLEGTVARQIQAQFQTSGKQALQEALKSNMEASVIPAFEMSCKSMFERVDVTFQRGMGEHTAAVQQHVDSAYSPLAMVLRDAISSVSTASQSLSGELADGRRKLIALATVGPNISSINPLISKLSNGHLGVHEKVEVPLDPTKELLRLVSERKYEEAFTGALQRSDVSIVSWLCAQVDLPGIFAMVPVPLSQGILLSLLQQLACDINKETGPKLSWMTDVAVAINTGDPTIAIHVHPIFDQVYQILNHRRSLGGVAPAELSSIRVLMHVINSVLVTCK